MWRHHCVAVSRPVLATSSGGSRYLNAPGPHLTTTRPHEAALDKARLSWNAQKVCTITTGGDIQARSFPARGDRATDSHQELCMGQIILLVRRGTVRVLALLEG